MKREKQLFRIFTVVALMLLPLTACADNDKLIKFEQLPVTAQKFVKTHFAGKKVLFVKKDIDFTSHDYEVALEKDVKIEFNAKGNWTEVECKHGAVPAAIIPSAIKSYVNKNYPSTPIRKIERNNKGYEIKLGNKIEIEFNKKMKVVDIDM